MTEMFQTGIELGDLRLERHIALLEFSNSGCERIPFLVPLLFLGGKPLQLVSDRFRFLRKRANRTLERVELALAGGDGHFARAQIGAGLFEARLQGGLFALNGALAAAGFSDLLLQGRERCLEFIDLVLTREDRALWL